jgi:hypothetical protein
MAFAQSARRFRAISSFALLAYIFKAIPGPSSDPFDFALPPPSGFLSPSEARSSRETRCQIRS